MVRARVDGAKSDLAGDADTFAERDDDDIWIRVDPHGATPPKKDAPAKKDAPVRPRRTLPKLVAEEIHEAAGAGAGAKLAPKLADAVHAYDRDRYQDALNILRPLARAVPTAPAVREVLGLTLYRLGRWRAALEELERYRELSQSDDQLPVMMDCLRALHQEGAVDELWDELRKSSPGGDVVAEGRIVMAGCLADRGELAAAVRLLEKDVGVRQPRLHHLREWYALADLYERTGDIPRARGLFRRVNDADPESFDARDRLRALR